MFKISGTSRWLFLFSCFSDSGDYTRHNKLPLKSGKLNKILAKSMFTTERLWQIARFLYFISSDFWTFKKLLGKERWQVDKVQSEPSNSQRFLPATSHFCCHLPFLPDKSNLRWPLVDNQTKVAKFKNSFGLNFFNFFFSRLLAQTTLRNILGTKNLHEILSDRESISGSMQVKTFLAIGKRCNQGSWQIRPWTIGPQGPIVRGPTVHFLGPN